MVGVHVEWEVVEGRREKRLQLESVLNSLGVPFFIHGKV